MEKSDNIKGDDEGMTLTTIEKIHKNHIELLLLNSTPFTTDIQHALVFTLECIEDKERDAQ